MISRPKHGLYVLWYMNNVKQMVKCSLVSILTSSESLGCWRGPVSLCRGNKCCPGFWCPCNQNQTQPSASCPTPGSPPIHWPSAGCYCLCGDHSLSEAVERARCETMEASNVGVCLLCSQTRQLTLFCICSMSIPKCDKCSDMWGSNTASSSSNE